MACGATINLKRHLEFDPVHSPSLELKRRRCGGAHFSPAASGITVATSNASTTPVASPFAQSTTQSSDPRITEWISKSVRSEFKRLKRRHRIRSRFTTATRASPSSPSSCSSSDSESSSLSPTHSQPTPLPSLAQHHLHRHVEGLQLGEGEETSKKSKPTSDSSVYPLVTRAISSETPNDCNSADEPVFSVNQVTVICQRILSEFQDQLSAEYDSVLRNKLSEQYETFLRFNHDQVQRMFVNRDVSYVS